MKKRFGFSLAEMMIVMLVVAIILAATAPMITRRISRERSDKIFDQLASDPPNAVSYIKGRAQRIYMNGKSGGYIGIVENGVEIPSNSVIFGNPTIREDSGVPGSKFVSIGFGNAVADSSVAIGYNSVSYLKGVAIGKGADARLYSVAIGYNANTTNYDDIVIGYSAKTKAYRSIAIGNYAKVYTTHGVLSDSVAIGYSAKVNKSDSIAIGYNAVASALRATAIGYGATADKANTIVLGTSNDTVYIPGNLVVEHSALIGRAANQNDNLYFRPYAQEDGRHFAVMNAGDWKGEDSNLAMVQDANNTDNIYVKVGPYQTTVERWRKDYKDNNRAHIDFDNPNNGDNTRTYKHSDIRLKNVGEEYTGGLAEIEKLKLYNYTYKNDTEKTPQVGVIAQDLQKVFPTAVKTGEDGYLLIRWDEMFYSAINAIKELNAKIIAITENIKTITQDILDLKKLTESQQATIEAQQAEIKDLTARVEKLEKKR